MKRQKKYRIPIFTLILYFLFLVNVRLVAQTYNFTNVCPATTVDLTIHAPLSTPSGTTVSYHSATPATAVNELTLAQAQAVAAGTYYMAFKDAANNCYSPTQLVTVSINSCATYNFTNVCPATTVDLTTHAPLSTPSGTTVSYHTGTPATAANELTLAQAQSVGAGTYYMAFKDATNNCYSPTQLVTVSINSCATYNFTNVCPATTVDLTTHAPLSTPSGTTVSYHTATPATAANELTLAQAQAVVAGTYYMAFKDAANNCYSPTQLVTVTINVCNQPPLASNDVAVTPQGKPVSGNILTNDKDPEGGVLTVTTTPTTPPNKGTVVLNPDGTYTYTPSPTATGEDTFCYEVSDVQGLKNTACVTIDIVPMTTHLNDAPVAVDDNSQTEQDLPVVIAVKANDNDPEGLPLGNPTAVTSPTNGTVVYNPDGTVTYTPNAGFTGTDSFKYSICDTGSPSKCDTATVTVNVVPTIPGNNPPVAVDDAKLTTKNTPVGGTVATNDSDVDNTAAQLSYTKLTNPTNGTVSFATDGIYTYTPNTNYIGNDSYTYKVCDPSGACDTATVVIAVLDPGKVSLLPQAYLQGALFGVTGSPLMRDDLRAKGMLPASSPYPAMGFTEVTPTSTVAPSVFNVTGANAIVDWVFVELRDANNPQTALDTRSALIQRDGDIVDLDGISALQFNQATPGSYYVVVKHRNHLGVMSKTALALSQAVTTVDFRTPSTPTYTLSSNITDVAQVVVEQGVALWAGNALYDTKVVYQGTANDVNSIYQLVINAPNNLFVSPFYKLKTYNNGDINMNGETIFQGTTNDVEFIYQNIIKNHPGNVLKQNFFIIKEQLP